MPAAGSVQLVSPFPQTHYSWQHKSGIWSWGQPLGNPSRLDIALQLHNRIRQCNAALSCRPQLVDAQVSKTTQHNVAKNMSERTTCEAVDNAAHDGMPGFGSEHGYFAHQYFVSHSWWMPERRGTCSTTAKAWRTQNTKAGQIWAPVGPVEAGH